MKTPNPYLIVDIFEKAVAEYTGAPYAVAVESCTAALFLSLKWLERQGDDILIPSRTYPGVACSIIHSGNKVRFIDVDWEGEYQLGSTNIWDAALRFKKGMYYGGFQCLSFHGKKLLPIGRGGMILTSENPAYEWLKKARFDGRSPVPLQEDNFTMLGWNCYLQPEQAARGLQLMQSVLSKYPDGPPDLRVEDQKYPDLSKFPIYNQ